MPTNSSTNVSRRKWTEFAEVENSTTGFTASTHLAKSVHPFKTRIKSFFHLNLRQSRMINPLWQPPQGEERLSLQTTYPYSFSFIMSERGIQATIFYIAATNSWNRVASFWWIAELFDSAIAAARRLNVTDHPSLIEPDDAEWAVEAWQHNLVRLIRSYRLRIVVFFIPYERLGYQAMCRVHRSRLVGMQYFLPTSLRPGWYLQDYPASMGDCSSDEMYVAVQGRELPTRTV